jgi:hypothetical protein
MDMDPIVDTVLDIISKCVDATIAGDLHPSSEKFKDSDYDNCCICLNALFECTGEDGCVVGPGVREIKCPGSHKFHSQCLRSWLARSKLGDCPICRHNFHESVREDCEANLEHQIQPCSTAIFTCIWSKTYDQRVSAVKVIEFCKSSSDLPFSETVASAFLWSLSEQRGDPDEFGDDISELVLPHIGDALQVLSPQSGWSYCASLVKAFDFAESGASKNLILHGIRAVSVDEDYGATLVSLGCFSILINSLKTSYSDWDSDEGAYLTDMIAYAMYNFVLHEELGPVLLRELLQAFKVADAEYERQRFAIAIYEIALSQPKTNDELDSAGCIALISGGACTALIEDLKKSNTICNHASLNSQKIDCSYFDVTFALFTLARSLNEYPASVDAFVDANACEALVATLRIFRMNVDVQHTACNMKPACHVLNAMNSISQQRIGCVTLVAADAVPELIGVLKKAGPIIEGYQIAETPDFSVHWNEQIQETAVILSNLVKTKEGRVELIKSDACGALIEILRNPGASLHEEILCSIKQYIVWISRVDDGLMINALVKGLHVASNDYARSRFSYVIGRLALSSLDPVHFISSGSCCALVQAFKMTEDNGVRKDIVDAIDILLKNVRDSRASLVAAGAVGVLKESLEMGCCSSEVCAIADVISFLSEPEKVHRRRNV